MYTQDVAYERTGMLKESDARLRSLREDVAYRLWLDNGDENGFTSARVAELLAALDTIDALRAGIGEARHIIAFHTDSEECHFDHHGRCQAHSLSAEPCVNARARAWLAQYSPQETPDA